MARWLLSRLLPFLRLALIELSNYLPVIADQSQVESALAQRDTAKVPLDQTTDQKKAGLAGAVDVLRSDVELQAREQKLIVARNNLAKQKLVLARAIGLPAGQTFDITRRLFISRLRLP
jgi:outer membrane protein TolC